MIAEKIHRAFPACALSYDKGYRDALESLCLALAGKVDEKVLEEGLETAMDAFDNNHDYHD